METSPLYSVIEGVPRLARSVEAGRRGMRRLRELADVAATEVSATDDRVQYWTFGDVHPESDRILPSWLQYDLTFLSAHEIGWERSKTHGHVHVGSETGGFAELYEVLEGRAGVFVQDLLPGPSAGLAFLIEADVGETVVIPPGLHHATINLGPSMVVLGDLIARDAEDEYAAVSAARGMSSYIGTLQTRPNPAYAQVPTLATMPAAEWSAAVRDPVAAVLSDPSEFAWLRDASEFSERFGRLAARLGQPDPHGG